MAKFNTLLKLRLKPKGENKMTALAKQSSSGSLSSFTGIFPAFPLGKQEKEAISTILKNYREDKQGDINNDLDALIAITSEVKAITNQAIMLHGERIKKAREILKKYQDGAFTAWLISTYGNRQTPYNFLQYYEFYSSMPKNLHSKIDKIPRQAIYTLASRNIPFEEKQKIIENYSGEPKQKILSAIRNTFPLSIEDKRQSNVISQFLSLLKKIDYLLENPLFFPTKSQKIKIFRLLNNLHAKLKKKLNQSNID